MMIVHILRMFKSKHPWKWDGILSYVQNSHNRSFHSSNGHNHFHVCMGFHPLAPIDITLPLLKHRKNLPMLKPRLIRKQNLLNGSITSNNDSMIFCIKLMPSASNYMINIGFCTSFRWVITYGFVFRKSDLEDPIASFTYFVMGLTPSPRLWVRILLN